MSTTDDVLERLRRVVAGDFLRGLDFDREACRDAIALIERLRADERRLDWLIAALRGADGPLFLNALGWHTWSGRQPFGDARAAIDAALREKASLAACAFCGIEAPRQSEAMAQHMLDCEKHPIRKLIEQNDLLREKLEAAERAKDGAYEERNRVVAALARAALLLGYRALRTRTAIEGWSDDWHGCIRIDLPTGQVSWHFHDSHAALFDWLPDGEMEWDGHTTPEKYERVALFAKGK